MIQILTGLALGIVIFAVTVGVGIVVLTKFGDGIAECSSGFEYNVTTRGCQNATNYSDTATTVTPGFSTINTLLGDTNGVGALVTWVGAIIALVVGLVFIGMLMGKKKY